jgi:hypothetical protein
MRNYTALGQISLGFGQGMLLLRGQGLVIKRSILDRPELRRGTLGLEEFEKPERHVELAVGQGIYQSVQAFPFFHGHTLP